MSGSSEAPTESTGGGGGDGGGGGGSGGLVGSVIAFIAGASYGATSVIVGQPLDTIKTRMQAHAGSLQSSPLAVARDMVRKSGLIGLYRGSAPTFLGGALYRSAQFGV